MSALADEEDPYFDIKPKVNYWIAQKTPDDQKVYYYNRLTKQTQWELPQEFKEEQEQVQKLRYFEKPLNARHITGTCWYLVVTNLRHFFWFDNEKKESTWHMPQCIEKHVQKMRELDIEMIKKAKMQEAEIFAKNSYKKPMEDQSTSSPDEGKEGIKSKLEALRNQIKLEEEQDTTKTPSNGLEMLSPQEIEQREAKFIEMLRETGVSAFSVYESHMPKVKNDPRYTLIPKIRHRKSLFDRYCRELAQQKPSSSDQGGTEAARNDFMQLLEEALHGNPTVWEAFRMKYKRDKRFVSIGSREALKLFKEYVSKLKKNG